MWYRSSFLIVLCLVTGGANAATTQKHYYAHDAVEDEHGVIAPWYRGQNGQMDWRVRIAAETLKRYPWTKPGQAPRQLPEYMWSGAWNIDKEGKIVVPPIDNWANGDLGQRAAYVLAGWVDYYRYSGDAAAIAHMSLMADMLLDFALTPEDHPWPRFLISVPTKGKPYGQADPHGFIQLDNSAETGIPLIKAAQIVGGAQGERWMAAARHWGDLFAEKRDRRPGVPPWGRYANPQDVPWEDNMTGNVVFLLEFFDTLIATGYTGKDNAIVEARKAGVAWLQTMLDKWLVHDTWGRNFWDWNAPVQLENVTEFVARYVMEHQEEFPNWRNDARNILTLFLNRTATSPKSNTDTYSGAWAHPESSGCCGRSLWYGPLEIAPMYAELGALAKDLLMAEIGRRQMILATYDAHENGIVEDNIDGGQIVAGAWFKIAHPMALKHCLNMIAWQPELFGPPGENHIVRSTATIREVHYHRNVLSYDLASAPVGTQVVLRLAFRPTRVWLSGDKGQLDLKELSSLSGLGYSVQPIGEGDSLVTVRQDGYRHAFIGDDGPQSRITSENMRLTGAWNKKGFKDGIHLNTDEAGASVEFEFNGDQVRIIGWTEPAGGLADVYLDGVKQLCGIDFWGIREYGLHDATLWYRTGLEAKKHTLRVVATGRSNPIANGLNVFVKEAYVAAHHVDMTAPPGANESISAQRWIFGYPERTDYVDSAGNAWRPATEWVVRAGNLVDSVAAAWWTARRCHEVEGTSDPELYRYGAHGKEFWADFTVSPGTYHVRLKFAETRRIDPKLRAMNIFINGKEVVHAFNIAATAFGGKEEQAEAAKKPYSGRNRMGRAVDLVFNGIEPKNGVIDVRFEGSYGGEAIVQAIEVGPGDGGIGETPISLPPPAPTSATAPAR